MTTKPSTVDLFSIEQLMQRYEVKSRSRMLTRIYALHLKPVRQGRKNFYTLEQVEGYLDPLHQFLKESNSHTIDQFVERLGFGSSTTALQQSSVQFGEQSVRELAQLIAQELSRSTLPTSVEAEAFLDAIRALSELSALAIPTPTTVVAQYLGLSPKTIVRFGESFERRGFQFERVSQEGRQLAWRIRRENCKLQSRSTPDPE